MKPLNTCLVASMMLAIPFAAFAQANTADGNYCMELSHKYEKYVSSAQDKRPRPAPVAVGEAMTRCQSGDTASAIPVLERALKDAKVDLPPRT